jgi:hypothetical protein
MNQKSNSDQASITKTKTPLFPPIVSKAQSKTKPLTPANEVIHKEYNSTKKPNIDLSLPPVRQSPTLLAVKALPAANGDSKNKESIADRVKKRLDALKVLQLQSAKLEVNFYEDLYMLECKYSKANRKIYESRRKIINGDHEPSNQESDLDLLYKKNNFIGDSLLAEREIGRDIAVLEIIQKNNSDEIKGLPDFWLNVLEKVSLVSQLIEEHDKPILKHLIDIDVELGELKPYRFQLNFHFSANEYFKETLLTKTYMFKIELDKENPFMFEAPESQRSLGCQITWNEKKNVTLAENKLQESFFNYFSSSLSKDKATCEDETEIALDYEIGYLFKEKIIPRAILYYLDEIVEDNDDDDDIHEDYEDVESIDLNDSLQKIKEN